ncbi:chloride channel protein [Microlunatus elymi]|uniref:chloride channel protein n=1 Tax=Microlunatus elymi TaxID=2596828 RepID=UPI001AEFACC2|nr:chloride channel protein [Microlunatus elymi]
MFAQLGGWLRGSRFGLFSLALVVGVGAGLGAVAFRYLVNGVTWLATGHAEFGQDGRIPSDHLPWLGLASYIVIPALGGLVYGPLVYRFAREARGHGVPEVMVAVAEQGGRIRPRVAVVKALASALTIGTGGSVGREGPIVQIGSAMASSLGQWVRVPESRMRVLVACGASGAIAATFNAPITGVFFAVEIILRELAGEALFAVMLSAMVADAIAVPLLGAQPFLVGFPRTTVMHHPANYILVVVLAVIAALIGQLYSRVLYGLEDVCDKLWGKRPEWARPIVGGLLVGLLLLAIPQLYGVGYPVMFKAVAGDYALWFLVLLMFGKILATSLTLGVGGSGGVFGPSLFIGLMGGTAFGVVVDHLFGPAAGDPALYAAVGMAGVFTSSTRAPLSGLASVVEMTGDFALTLPVMLTVAVSTAISRAISYGTIYTTKLLRRGQDIERTAPWRAFTDLTAVGAMRRLRTPLPVPTEKVAEGRTPTQFDGDVVAVRDPQVVFESESIVDVLRHLERHRRDGIPVLSEDGLQITGWVTNRSILQTIRRRLALSEAEAEKSPDTEETVGRSPMPGYQVLEVGVTADSQLAGHELRTIDWPAGAVAATVIRDDRHRHADDAIVLRPGDRVGLLVRS